MLDGKRSLVIVLLLAALTGLAGCATKKAAPAAPADFADDLGPVVADPIEPWNRFWFAFNDSLYIGVVKPVSKVYTTIVPKYGRDRIENAYSNFLFPVRFVNAVLQLRPDMASRELGRFLVNSTFGIGGLYDLAASKPDMGPQKLDFGQTLGVWGFGHGFYLVLPVVGPSSLRDGIGIAGDVAVQPTTYLQTPIVLTLAISGAGRMNRFPEMIDIYEELKRSSIEPYTAARDAYVQLRAKIIEDARRSNPVFGGQRTPAAAATAP
ncbi:VacJ family lipoprotein [Fundidesulfovibrio soli]|uniref:MlaA family lipoprotein n=1 Tax=Fundidesulfovibrio soli TaxID=2922716 RepID=UPI001FB003D2|nr:VacJ family lipoprotein [Fundidesulfovibrio soli]